MFDYWTPNEVAQALGITRQTVNVWIHNNKFPNVRRLGGNYIIPTADVADFVKLRIAELENEATKISIAIDRLKKIPM